MPLFQRRVIFYHSFIFLSSSFFRTFSFQREELVCQVLTAKNILSESFSLVKNFFYFFFTALSVFQQRIVCYHIVSDLSTTIFNFFLELFRCVPTAKYILPSTSGSVNTFYGSFRSTFNHVFSLRIKTKVSSFAYSSEYWKSSRSKPFTSSISSICFSAR